MPFDENQPRDNQGQWTAGDATEAIQKAASDRGSEENNKELNTVEAKIRDQKFESAAIFKDGKQVFFKDGKYSEVEFNDDELIKMEGSLLTHNHPMDRSFSEGDIGMFKDYNLSEMRAVSKNHTYVLKNTNNIKLTEDFVKDYHSLYIIQATKMQKDIDRHLLSESFANENVHHIIMKKLSDAYKLDYKKIKL